MALDLLKIFLSSIFSVIVLFALTRLMGKRQLSQLNMFDYIIGITIGSIAAEMATEIDGDVIKPLLSMVVYAVVSILISYINYKSIKVRRFIMGKPIMLMKNGKLYRENFKKAKLDMNEFLVECRVNGYFDLSSVHDAILEPNGKISFLPITAKNPATPQDLNIKVEQEELFADVILDGEIQHKNLKNIGKDETWLANKLNENMSIKPSDVFLATCDINGTLNLYLKIDEENEKDIFV